MTKSLDLRCGARRLAVLFSLLFALLTFGPAGTASAHSLESTTIAVTITDDSVDATISVALATVDQALGTGYVAADIAEVDDELIAYLGEHLTVTGGDGTVWNESFSDVERETVEGIDSISVDISFDTGDSTITQFTLAYDAIIETISNHQAVVVLTDSNVDISTVGVLTGGDTSLVITDGSHSVPVADMVRYGFDHVLEGADHLLFLTALLLPAPFIVVAGRWRRGTGAWPTLKKVVHVVTSFTIGHSITLILSALGWVRIPGRPVEILIAASVGVSAVHAIRPLASHGEEFIAVGFGLIHGLAFAGILTDLGLDGTASLLTLLAFNIGIELSQLVATLFVFPSLYALSTTRYYRICRVAGASLALAASVGWAQDRLGLLSNPFAGLEEAAIDHPWRIVVGLATVAAIAVVVDRRVLVSTDTDDARYPLPGPARPRV